jgi:hypothetical protein
VPAVRSGAIVYRRGRVNKAVVVGDHYPALLRARRRRDRWSAEDKRPYQRHRWRSEGLHGEAKTWHGLARAVRRGLVNIKIQEAYLTAAAINLKRLAAAVLVLLARWMACQSLIPANRPQNKKARPFGKHNPLRAGHGKLLQRPHRSKLPSRFDYCSPPGWCFNSCWRHG